MPKGKNSWSVPNIPDIIARKKVDLSIFEYGIHIPQELHTRFKIANGNIHIEQGQRHELILIIEDKEFKASFSNIDIKNFSKDTFQIRYDSNKELKQLLQDKLKSSYNFILKEKNQLILKIKKSI